jgi:hypothetical protein
LREINVLAQNNLFVMVAACHGAHLMKMIDPTDRSPFCGVFGPSEELTARDVFVGYKAFYEEALTSSGMGAALQALKRAIPHKADKFTIWSSEHLFMMAFRHYIAQHCTGVGLEVRVREMLQEIQEEKGLDPIEWSSMGEQLRQRLSGQKGQHEDYEKFRHKFFMHDLYPAVPDLPSPEFERMMQIRISEKDASP